ncbi:MAG: hypothetical protein ABSC51_06505 [Gaiellaceae bacterium]
MARSQRDASPSGTFRYSYDGNGNLLSRTYPDGLQTSYSYDAAGELTSASVGSKKTLYTYDADGRLASTLHPNGILDTRSYDASGRVSEIEGTSSEGVPLYSRSYSYDAVGNPTSLVATAPRDDSPGWWGPLWHQKGAELTRWTETYTYDSRNRLVKACMNESCSHFFAYTYDPVGNWTSLETRRGTTMARSPLPR